MCPLPPTSIALSLIASVCASPLPTPAWGALEPAEGEPGAYTAEVPPHDEATRLMLPTPFPNIVSASVGDRAIPLEFNADATEIALHLPAKLGGTLRLEIAENTVQHSDGRIVFSALDAQVAGETAKLETHPGNHRVGFWSKVGDSVEWEYKASRPGMYDVSLTYSLAAGESQVAVRYGDSKVECELPATGSWYRYTTIPAGRVYLPKAGKTSLAVVPLAKGGAAVMNLKAVLLTPAPEGEPVVQDGDSITFDSSAATVHSVKLQYERKPVKLCLGYWVHAEDWASWDFTAKQPGRYKVMFTQGCGKGHGGSVIDVLLGDQKIEFTVEDTGSFQNWKERDIGMFEIAAAGEHRLEVRPRSKAAGAVMDIRRIVLVKQ